VSRETEATVIDAGTGDARERLEAALGVRRWVEDVATGGPYPTLDALTAAVDAAGADLTDDELDEAVSRPPASDVSEPSGLPPGEGLDRADEGVDAAIARGNEVYEQRFGRAFLIRTAGLGRQEVLDELQRRLKNDPADEAAEAKQQLRDIAVQRVAALFGNER
jgi:2-oxo-4-hydroxy-4-carboxy-5-ureidoimidazoline decarboxylase